METIKIVINTSAGHGFDLSPQAVMRYAELKGITIIHEKPLGYDRYYISPKGRFYTYEIPRDDKDLVAVVEELGKKANYSEYVGGILSQQTELKVVEIPADVKWQIDSYQGKERVQEVSRQWS